MSKILVIAQHADGKLSAAVSRPSLPPRPSAVKSTSPCSPSTVPPSLPRLPRSPASPRSSPSTTPPTSICSPPHSRRRSSNWPGLQPRAVPGHDVRQGPRPARRRQARRAAGQRHHGRQLADLVRSSGSTRGQRDHHGRSAGQPADPGHRAPARSRLRRRAAAPPSSRPAFPRRFPRTRAS